MTIIRVLTGLGKKHPQTMKQSKDASETRLLKMVSILFQSGVNYHSNVRRMSGTSCLEATSMSSATTGEGQSSSSRSPSRSCLMLCRWTRSEVTLVSTALKKHSWKMNCSDWVKCFQMKRLFASTLWLWMSKGRRKGVKSEIRPMSQLVLR